MSKGGEYHSFLLRMWQVPANDENAWRILLENIQTGEKNGFSSLAELSAYLSALTAKVNGKPGEGSHIEVQG